ncbi:ABC transporter substrate-binding protein [Actinokineospora bangkokensis]|uniref:LacI family transcriptional regulator n=1 Tax=Actinokineospora bangkokensis TaxID=1193682 RepID=A0A1Q9LNF4_9PSEU|nr:ABC transporter substrate-binding protein [Actinokineospora bangkokensis]OLR93541.1 LacI family transcriptional regulator [Actinokineospora bangkokensis]
MTRVPLRPNTSHRVARPAALVAAAAIALAGCANPEGSGSGTTEQSGGTQVVKTGTASGPGCTLEQYGATKVELKDAVVGFSQSEKEANPFRIAETASIKAEAQERGVRKLLTTNADSNLGKQVSDIQSMLAQGAQVLIVAPLNSEGLEPALQAARAKNVPVITVDRKLTSATACKDYLTFIGSDFVEQGKRAGEAMAKATGGTAKVAILLGSSGNNVTTDRTSGFKDYVAANAPGIEVVAEQTGDFSREKGQTVTENLLQANPGITAVYAENDEMALGAVTAIKSAGRKPGTDVKVVSVDGTRNAVQGIVDGEVNAVIESNPRFGPLAFDTIAKFLSGESIQSSVVIEDKQYDRDNAAAEVSAAY